MIHLTFFTGLLWFAFGVFPLIAFGQEYKAPLGLGETAPDFTAVNQAGKEVHLQDLLKEGPVVVFFYRGSWCPYCNRHVQRVQDSLQMILNKGASVIAITPDKPEYIEQTLSKTGATFHVLYDEGYKIMQAYHVDFVNDPDRVTRYSKKFGNNYTEARSDDSHILPVPATYIIARNGKIWGVHFDPDYKKRLSVQGILEYL